MFIDTKEPSGLLLPRRRILLPTREIRRALPKLMVPGTYNPPGDFAEPLSYTYNGAVAGVASSASPTITSVPLGAARPKLTVICLTTNSVTVSAATIDGVTATFDRATGTNVAVHMLWAVTSNATGSVALTYSGASPTYRLTSYTIYGYQSATPNAFNNATGGGNSSRSTTLTSLVAGAIFIAAACGDQSVGSATWSGTSGVASNGDERWDNGVNGFSSASIVLGAAGSYTATNSNCRAITSRAWA